ncbi:MAG: hypothetical protein Q9168_005693 [Polycauliona sp. 1 TL-2023]
MTALNIDEWMDNFMAELAPDNEPRDIPTASETKTLNDYLHGRISVDDAAFAYTRDTVAETTSGDLWFLLFNIAQDLPQVQTSLIELLRAIATLPDEQSASGRTLSWIPVGLMERYGDAREHWEGQVCIMSKDSATASDRRAFIAATMFIGRLRAEGLLRSNFFSTVVMSRTLEFEESVDILGTYLLATDRFLEWVVQDVFAESSKGEWRAGPLLQNERQAKDVGRWDFWKGRMGVLGEEPRLSQESRDAAKSCVARMVEVENGTTG